MINIIILCAGDGMRFGGKFKPLLKLDNQTFIEHCLEQFIKYDSQIIKYYFILRKDQERDNNFYDFLIKKYPDLKEKFDIFLLEKRTIGPYQGLNIFSKIKKIDNFIVCDCDHSINIEPIINNITYKEDIIIPLWNIKLEEHKNWGKLLIKNNKVVNFYEKEIVNEEGIYGMIGCYYFRSTDILEVNDLYENISDYLKNNFDKLILSTVMIEKAYFFGTPEMVEYTVNKRRNLETIIFDIDGTLLLHSSHSNENIEDNKLIGECVKIIDKLKEDKMIILMSARPENVRKDLIELLNHNKIYFDKLILGVNPGSRYLVNDIKPGHIFTRQSLGYNIIRNSGINELSFNENNNNDIKIIRVFKGGSFSKTCLIESNKHLKVRKYIIKKEDNYIHYEKIKRQCDDMKRFYYYGNITPKILGEVDNDYMFYYDMEYLEDYNNLEDYDDNTVKDVLNILIETMNKNIYCIRCTNNSSNFWKDFMDEKIFPKLDVFEKDCEIMNYLINNNVIINDKCYLGLRCLINKLNLSYLEPKFLSPIHGDFTLENILYNENTKDFKIIDMDGSRYIDSPAFDLGKIFQSLVSNFKEWKKEEKLILNKDINNLLCKDKYFNYNFDEIEFILEHYSKILNFNINDTKKIGIFCMSSYFIRFIPFMEKISHDTAIFSMILSIVWLNKIL